MFCLWECRKNGKCGVRAYNGGLGHRGAEPLLSGTWSSLMLESFQLLCVWWNWYNMFTGTLYPYKNIYGNSVPMHHHTTALPHNYTLITHLHFHRVQLPARPLLFSKTLHMFFLLCAYDTKQYNLVPATAGRKTGTNMIHWSMWCCSFGQRLTDGCEFRALYTTSWPGLLLYIVFR